MAPLLFHLGKTLKRLITSGAGEGVEKWQLHVQLVETAYNFRNVLEVFIKIQNIFTISASNSLSFEAHIPEVKAVIG